MNLRKVLIRLSTHLESKEDLRNIKSIYSILSGCDNIQSCLITLFQKREIKDISGVKLFLKNIDRVDLIENLEEIVKNEEPSDGNKRQHESISENKSNQNDNDNSKKLKTEEVDLATRKTNKARVVIICTRDHEADVFNQLLKEHEQEEIPKQKGDLSGYPGFKYWEWDILKFELFVVSFKQLQGPVIAASRTAQVIYTLKPDKIGMIGICGGRELGSVIMATDATDPFYGRVIKPGLKTDDLNMQTENGYYLINTEKGTDSYTSKWLKHTSIDDLEVDVFIKNLAELKNPFNTIAGTLYQANAVREDSESLFKKFKNTTKGGIDMETYSFYDTTTLLQKAFDKHNMLLISIKAVSDVGKELDQQNPLFAKNSEELKRAVENSEGMSHYELRSKYREYACKHAGLVMISFLEHCVEIGRIKSPSK